MIQGTKKGAELSTKLAELRVIESGEAFRTAMRMQRASAMLDERLSEARRMEREGKQLIAEGMNADAICEIICELGGLEV